ncbi:MAG: hypothetical protein AAFQ82_16300 [Myxococcota bacterium]
MSVEGPDAASRHLVTGDASISSPAPASADLHPLAADVEVSPAAKPALQTGTAAPAADAVDHAPKAARLEPAAHAGETREPGAGLHQISAQNFGTEQVELPQAADGLKELLAEGLELDLKSIGMDPAKVQALYEEARTKTQAKLAEVHQNDTKYSQDVSDAVRDAFRGFEEFRQKLEPGRRKVLGISIGGERQPDYSSAATGLDTVIESAGRVFQTQMQNWADLRDAVAESDQIILKVAEAREAMVHDLGSVYDKLLERCTREQEITTWLSENEKLTPEVASMQTDLLRLQTEIREAARCERDLVRSIARLDLQKTKTVDRVVTMEKLLEGAKDTLQMAQMKLSEMEGAKDSLAKAATLADHNQLLQAVMVEANGVISQIEQAIALHAATMDAEHERTEAVLNTQDMEALLAHQAALQVVNAADRETIERAKVSAEAGVSVNPAPRTDRVTPRYVADAKVSDDPTPKATQRGADLSTTLGAFSAVDLAAKENAARKSAGRA